MRTRDLKPGFFKNEVLAKLDPRARLLFEGLWLIADRQGRLEDRPARIAGDVFPYEKPPIDRLLSALEVNDFIKRYEVAGRKYIWLPTFRDHQRVHPHEKASVIPPCPDELATCNDMSLKDALQSSSLAVSFSGPSSASEPSSSARASLGWPDRDEDGAETFRQVYRQRYEQTTGKPISGNRMLIAGQLEKQYSSATCIEVAEAHGWDKHPNYYRGPLEDMANGRYGSPHSNGAHEAFRPPAAVGADVDDDAPKRIVHIYDRATGERIE